MKLADKDTLNNYLHNIEVIYNDYNDSLYFGFDDLDSIDSFFEKIDLRKITKFDETYLNFNSEHKLAICSNFNSFLNKVISLTEDSVNISGLNLYNNSNIPKIFLEKIFSNNTLKFKQCFIGSLILENSKFEEIIIQNSEISFFEMRRCHFDVVSLYENKIYQISFYNNLIHKECILHLNNINQINIMNTRIYVITLYSKHNIGENNQSLIIRGSSIDNFYINNHKTELDMYYSSLGNLCLSNSRIYIENLCSNYISLSLCSSEVNFVASEFKQVDIKNNLINIIGSDKYSKINNLLQTEIELKNNCKKIDITITKPIEGSPFNGLDLFKIKSLYYRYTLHSSNKLLSIGCKTHTIEHWNNFFKEECDLEYLTKRDTQAFEIIKMQYLDYIKENNLE